MYTSTNQGVWIGRASKLQLAQQQLQESLVWLVRDNMEGTKSQIDMPLNSIPPTTTVDNFNQKVKAAGPQVNVDVRFIGGVVPDNKADLVPMLNSGICGFKCFLIQSGVDEFPHVSGQQAKEALLEMKDFQGTKFLMFHAEVELEGHQNTHEGKDSK